MNDLQSDGCQDYMNEQWESVETDRAAFRDAPPPSCPVGFPHHTEKQIYLYTFDIHQHLNHRFWPRPLVSANTPPTRTVEYAT